MSAYSELILFVVNLSFNLLLFGTLIAGSIAVSFDLIKNAAPRLRFTVAVAAFLLAAFFPVVVTFNGSTGLETIFEAKQNSGTDAFDDNFDNQNSFIKSESNSPVLKAEPEKPSLDLLNNFTTLIAGSFVGTLIFIFWVLVSAAFLLKDIMAHRRLKRARLLWRKATNSERAELALPDGIPLYFGEEGPATVGLLRPVIVLPEGFPDDLSLEGKRFVVQHELAHAQWRDPLVNCFLHLIRAIFWVSPALWMLERITGTERESAADFAAIIKSSANESDYEATALNYATTLVSVAKHFNSPARRGFLRAYSIGMSGGSRLENRVRRLLTRSSNTPQLRLFLASVIFASSLAGMLFMPVAFQAKQTDDEAKAVIINEQNSEEPPDKDDLRNSQTMRRQNEVPQIIEIIKNKEGKIKTGAAKQNENSPKEITGGAGETFEIPRVIFYQPKQNGTFNENSDDSSSREDLMRQLSQEDAKNSEVRRNLSELNGKLQSLDDAKRNLGNDMFRMRQKAAADALNAQKRQPRTVVNINQNINNNRNIN